MKRLSSTKADDNDPSKVDSPSSDTSNEEISCIFLVRLAARGGVFKALSGSTLDSSSGSTGQTTSSELTELAG